MNKIHLMMIPFTGLGLHQGYRGDVWFKNRIEIFKNYTLKALLNQTNKNFVVWFCFRKEEEFNPLLIELRKYMDRLPLKCVYTFGGICFWDDKYINDNLLERLENTLPELENLVSGYDWVLTTIQPSDDMFVNNAVEKIQQQEVARKMAFVWTKGCLINARTHQVAQYNPDTLPPFTTIVFPTKVFLDPLEHFNYIGPYKSHEFVKDWFQCKKLEGRGFMVGVHGENISTTWSTFKGLEYKGREKQDILTRFGVGSVEPIKIRMRPHLIARRFYNKLPNCVCDSIKKYVKRT